MCASMQIAAPSGLFQAETFKAPVLRYLRMYSVTCDSISDPILLPFLFPDCSVVLLCLLTCSCIDPGISLNYNFCLSLWYPTVCKLLIQPVPDFISLWPVPVHFSLVTCISCHIQPRDHIAYGEFQWHQCSGIHIYWPLYHAFIPALHWGVLGLE